jgi:hypothetical protein
MENFKLEDTFAISVIQGINELIKTIPELNMPIFVALLINKLTLDLCGNTDLKFIQLLQQAILADCQELQKSLKSTIN